MFYFKKKKKKMGMSISDYSRKITKCRKAISKINEANSKYQEAIVELKKNVGVVKCKELETKIEDKIDSLNGLKKEIKRKISNYEEKIEKLKKEESD